MTISEPLEVSRCLSRTSGTLLSPADDICQPVIIKKGHSPNSSIHKSAHVPCDSKLLLFARNIVFITTTLILSTLRLLQNPFLNTVTYRSHLVWAGKDQRTAAAILFITALNTITPISAQRGGYKNGAIRLVGGEGSLADPNTGTIYQGNVQIWLNGSWGHICDDEWDLEEAQVVCRQLGFESAKSRTRNSEYGIVTKYWLDNLNCDGKESSLMECRSHACDGEKIKNCIKHWGKNNCLISEAAGVVCKNPANHIIDNGIMPTNQIASNLMDKDSTDSQSTLTVTRQPSAFPPTTMAEIDEFFRTVAQYQSRASQVPANHRRRSPDEERRLLNASRGLDVNRHQIPSRHLSTQLPSTRGPEHSVSNRSLYIPPSSRFVRQRPVAQGDLSGTYYDQGNYQGGYDEMGPVQLRLAGGNAFSGRVEISMANGPWGTICGDAWTATEANVICRMLSFGYAEQALQGTSFGTSYGPMLLSGINCQGSEPHLSSCRFKKGAQMSCPGATNLAGVVCGQQLPDLVVDYREVEQTIHVDARSLAELTCAMEENCVSSSAYNLVQNDMGWGGSYRNLLRFTTAVANIGTADFSPILPQVMWDWHECHQHYHSFEVFSTYKVLDASGNSLANGHKASFCLEDAQCKYDVFPAYQCRDAGSQGISAGCIDVYRYDIDCQWVDITDLPAGQYKLEIVVNPERKVAELDYENNRVVCDITWDGGQVTTTGCRIEP